MLWVTSKNTNAEILLHIYLDSEYQEIEIIHRTHVVVCYPHNNHVWLFNFLFYLIFKEGIGDTLVQKKTDDVFCS